MESSKTLLAPFIAHLRTELALSENTISSYKSQLAGYLNFIDDNQELIVSIEPSLSPKKSHLISNSDNILKYKGYDPDYLFTVKLDDFDEVEQFTLEMPNRNLKIVYFE